MGVNAVEGRLPLQIRQWRARVGTVVVAPSALLVISKLAGRGGEESVPISSSGLGGASRGSATTGRGARGGGASRGMLARLIAGKRDDE